MFQLSEEDFFNRLLIYDKIDSTQFEAKRLIDKNEIDYFCAILTKEQTNGLTTKKDIKWESERGNFFCSFCFILDSNIDSNHLNDSSKTQEILDKANKIPYKIRLGIAKYIQSFGFNSKNITIKEPNDILINNKKVCGILSEIYKNYIIVGVGININSYPKNTINLEATSIKNELNKNKNNNKNDEIIINIQEVCNAIIMATVLA